MSEFMHPDVALRASRERHDRFLRAAAQERLAKLAREASAGAGVRRRSPLDALAVKFRVGRRAAHAGA
jgi:hypothetical protein